MKENMMNNEAMELNDEALDTVTGGAGESIIYRQCTCGQWIAISKTDGVSEVTERCIACGKLNIFRV